MEERYLIDTNILIYYFDNKIPESEVEKISSIFEESFNISTITKIEVLGWHKITGAMAVSIENFLTQSNVFYVDQPIEKKAIEIKQKNKIETPDGIIAATALLHNMTVVTRNEADFNKINGLRIYNPFKI